MSILPIASITPDLPQDPITEELEFKTLISNYEPQGREQRKEKWHFPRRNLTINYKDITKEQCRLLWAFYIARKGPREAFSVFLTRTDSYVEEYVGVGDGSTLTFNLPCKSSVGVSVYLDSVIQPSGYTLTHLSGADGEDKITFDSAPEAGAVITVTFTGYLKVRSRFMEDKTSFDDFYRRVFVIGLKLKGLLNDE
jgi:hypothetical protein